MLNRRHLITHAALASATLALPGFALAQTPTTRIIVPFAAGGPIDVTARILAERVKDTLGVVDREIEPDVVSEFVRRAVVESVVDRVSVVDRLLVGEIVLVVDADELEQCNGSPQELLNRLQSL